MARRSFEQVVAGVGQAQEEYAADPTLPPANHGARARGDHARSTVQLGVRVPPDVLEALRALSAESGVPIARIVVRALRAELGKAGTK